MSVIDQRSFRWPGFEQAIECFLIRFEYRFAAQSYSNIGIVGPATHAFACKPGTPDDGRHLRRGSLAGKPNMAMSIRWICKLPKVKCLARSIRICIGWKANFENVSPHFLGMFFETPVLVATVAGRRSGAGTVDSSKSLQDIADSEHDFQGFAVTDRSQTLLIPKGLAHAPITPELAFEIYKGRNLLQAFNDTVESI